MSYLTYQRQVKEIDAVAREWERIREVVWEVVSLRLQGNDAAAQDILETRLAQALENLSIPCPREEQLQRLEELFHHAYHEAAAARLPSGESGHRPTEVAPDPPDESSRPPSNPAPGRTRPSPALVSGRSSTPASRPRRQHRNPGANEIASMIDDMLTGSKR
jgi:hypothetical protein